MLKRIKQRLKNQKGLTLVELLAVVVILGIIAAIAVPAIGGIIENSKKDAEIANATQMINSAKLMVAAQDVKFTSNVATIPLSDTTNNTGLIEKGYLEIFKDSEGKDYTSGAVKITRSGNNHTYEVSLVGSKYRIGDSTTYVSESDLISNKRDEVDDV